METNHKIFHVRVVNNIIFTWTMDKLKEYLATYNKFTLNPNIVNRRLGDKGLLEILDELPHFGSYNTDYLELIFDCNIKPNGNLDIRWEYKKSAKMRADVIYPGPFIVDFKTTYPIKFETDSEPSIKIVDSTEKKSIEEKPCIKCVHYTEGVKCINCSISNNYRHFRQRELNLCELLKDSIGETFYMPHYGDVVLELVHPHCPEPYVYFITDKNHNCKSSVTPKGYAQFGNASEIYVFPSKENRDWSTYEPPKPKLEVKNTPLKQGDRVWVHGGDKIWLGRFFSHIAEDGWFHCYDTQKTLVLLLVGNTVSQLMKSLGN